MEERMKDLKFHCTIVEEWMPKIDLVLDDKCSFKAHSEDGLFKVAYDGERYTMSIADGLGTGKGWTPKQAYNACVDDFNNTHNKLCDKIAEYDKVWEKVNRPERVHFTQEETRNE